MRALTTLIKPVSGSCNMRCGYCFYADIMDTRDVHNYGRMDFDTLEMIVKKVLECATESCVFGFQGGEPMLAGIDFYKELMRLEKKYNINSVNIENTIQTNGTLITDEWAEFFAEHDFLIGVSIDAAKEQHDELRKDAKGKGTHKQCMKATYILDRYKVQYNILSVVTKEFAANPEKIYRFYKKNNFKFIQFIPCIDSRDQQSVAENNWTLGRIEYGRFLCGLFDQWYQDFINGDYYSIRIFDNFIRILAGETPENCAMKGTCEAYLLIEGDGTVFPCDFYAIDKYRLGNINHDEIEDMLKNETAAQFVKESYQLHEECKKCRYVSICRGGCRRDQEMPDGSLGLNRYCQGYKMFFAHTLSRMIAVAKFLFEEEQQ